jgi:hypothetical protein
MLKIKLLVRFLHSIGDKIKLVKIKEFFIDVYGWCKSVFIVLRSIKKPRIFFGYSSYWFALKYKARRENNWKCKWDQMGRQQGIFPINDTMLIVCSKMELVVFKKKGLANKNINPRKMMKKSY